MSNSKGLTNEKKIYNRLTLAIDTLNFDEINKIMAEHGLKFINNCDERKRLSILLILLKKIREKPDKVNEFVKIAEKLISDGVSFDKKDNSGNNALLLSVYLPDSYLFNLLIKQKGVDFNYVNNRQETALILTTKLKQDISFLQNKFEILLPETDIHLQDIYGDSALHSAVINSNIFFVQSLLEKKPVMNSQQMNSRNNSGDTFLHIAVRTCSRDKSEVSRLILLSIVDKIKTSAYKLIRIEQEDRELAFEISKLGINIQDQDLIDILSKNFDLLNTGTDTVESMMLSNRFPSDYKDPLLYSLNNLDQTPIDLISSIGNTELIKTIEELLPRENVIKSHSSISRRNFSKDKIHTRQRTKSQQFLLPSSPPLLVRNRSQSKKFPLELDDEIYSSSLPISKSIFTNRNKIPTRQRTKSEQFLLPPSPTLLVRNRSQSEKFPLELDDDIYSSSFPISKSIFNNNESRKDGSQLYHRRRTPKSLRKPKKRRSRSRRTKSLRKPKKRSRR